MEKIDITTRFKRDGSLVPIEFSLDKENVQVINIGRQWETGEGKHILVMGPNEHTYHLYFQLSDFSWYLIRDFKQSPDQI